MKTTNEARMGIVPKFPFRKENIIFVFLSAIIAGMASILLVQRFLALPIDYADFLVGNMSWHGQTRLQDIVSLPAFVIGFILAGRISIKIFSDISLAGGQVYENELTQVLSWWLIPMAGLFGGLLSQQPTAMLFTLPLALAGLIATVTAAHLNLRHRQLMATEIGTGVLAAMMLAILPAGISALLDRLQAFPLMPGIRGGMQLIFFTYLAACMLFFYLVAKKPELYKKHLAQVVVIPQAAIILFYLLIIPDMHVGETGQYAIPFREWLPLLSIALMGIAGRDLFQRWKQYKDAENNDLGKLCSPWAIFAVVILLKTGTTSPPVISSDDFQYGESLLGWWSYREFGMVPYIDYFPPNGLFVDDLAGFFSWVFFDGTAGTIDESLRLIMTLTLLAAFIGLHKATRSIGLSLVSVLFFAYSNMYWNSLNFLLLVPLFTLFLKYPADPDSRKWLLAWPAIGILLVLLAPSQGYIFLLASLPALIYHLRHAVAGKLSKKTIYITAGIGLLSLATPIPRMLYSAIRHLVEKIAIYPLSFGTDWTKGYLTVAGNDIPLLNYILLDFFRMSWIWVLLAGCIIFMLLIHKRRHWQYLALVALPATLFILLMTGYAMGRMDILNSSGPGILSSFSLTILLPLLLAPLLARYQKILMASLIAFFCAGIGNHHLGWSGLGNALEKNEAFNLAAAGKIGINNVGLAEIDPQHADRLLRVNANLKKYLRYREPYLDLTGNNAHYMYFDRPPAMSLTAPVNLVSIAQQEREVSRLRQDPPQIALLMADNKRVGEGKLALRNHILYRFVLSRYRAELHDGYVFAFLDTARLSTAAMTFMPSDRTDSAWLKGVHRRLPAVIIRDTLAIKFLRTGDRIILPDGKPAQIGRILPKEQVVWLDGNYFSPTAFDSPNPVRVILDDSRKAELSCRLMQLACSDEDLAQLPVTWGRSANSLDNRMTLVHTFDTGKIILKNIRFEKGGYQPMDDSSYMEFQLAGAALNGKQAGLLSFDFTSIAADLPARRMRISWLSDDNKECGAGQSLMMTAANGRLIVPLDGFPSWLNAKKISAIRIEMDETPGSSAFNIANIRLEQRIMTTTGLD
jgi:hypothetical protein